MTIRVDVIVGSQTYQFYDGDDFIVQDEDGFGLPPSDLIMDIAPLQHGAMVRDFRLRPRTIFLGIWMVANTESEHFQKRSQMIEALKLSSLPNKLRYTFTDGTKRQIDFFYAQGLTFPSVSRPMYKQKSAIALFCPDPLFYDPDGQSLTFAGGGSEGDNLEIPNPVPHVVGGSVSFSESKQIQYSGTWRSFPHLIRIYGPVTNPVITNETLNKKLDFTGATISDGDYYDIDLRFGYKTIKDSSGTNKIADLTNDSDLADWYIGSEPEVPGGDNSISVVGTTVTESTRIEITYTEKFVGF